MFRTMSCVPAVVLLAALAAEKPAAAPLPIAPIAIVGFENRTGVYHLGHYEALVPAVLREHLGRWPGLAVVEVEAREKVLAELAHGLSDLATDPSAADRVGEMLGARFLVTGSITSTGHRVRVDARIVEVATGAVMVERVEGGRREDLTPMLHALAHNVGQNLTGRGERVDSGRFRAYPVWIMTGVTAALAGGAVGLHFAYEARRDDYHAARALDDIAARYDDTRTFFHLRTAGIAAAALSAVATGVLFYLHHRDENQYDAGFGAGWEGPGPGATLQWRF
jgi:TolB-like protein